MTMTINQPNCIIIHGCPSIKEKTMDSSTRTYDKHWIPWAKQTLIGKGTPTIAPLMPNPWAPDYDAYKRKLEKYTVNENTILIGHSCGSAFLVRWLGETKQPIAKLILVAPWKIPEPGDTTQESFYTYQIDETIKDRVGQIIMFTSNDEEPEGKQSLQIFHAALGGKIIDLNDHGHYTLGDMGTEKFPELITEVAE